MQMWDRSLRLALRSAFILALAAAACGGGAGCGGCAHPHGTTPPDDATSEGIGPSGDAGPTTGPLRVGQNNRRYFVTGNGKPVYLTGSHTWDNFKDRAYVDPPPAFDYPAFLTFLVNHHHNFMRLWTWEQPYSAENAQGLMYTAQFPWLRTGPGTANDGKPKFDLDRLDPAYFARLRTRVAAARDRGIYVAVMLFDGWDLVNGYNSTDGGFPVAAANNINGIDAPGPTYYTVNNPAKAIQEAYVRAVIDAVNDLDNVLYEIANETDSSGIAWQYQMINFVKTAEMSRPQQHPVGMTSVYPGGSDEDLFNSPADWISPVGREVLSDGTKIILNDTDHSYGWSPLQSDGPAKQRAWAWKTLCLGAQPLFMDPYLDAWSGRNDPRNGKPDSAWNTIRDAIGTTRLYAERLNLERAVPSASLCSTGYCLAEPGHQYLVYQPGSGNFMLTVASGTYQFEWFNPSTQTVVQSGMTTLPAERHTFTPPFAGDAVLLLLQ